MLLMIFIKFILAKGLGNIQNKTDFVVIDIFKDKFITLFFLQIFII